MAVGFENSDSFSEVKCLQGCSKNSLFSFLVLLKDMRTFGVTQGYEDISCCFFFLVLLKDMRTFHVGFSLV